MGKKPSEDEFVSEGLSEEETAAIEAAADNEPQGDQGDADVEGAVAAGEPSEPKKKEPDEPKTVDIRALQEARAENRDLRERHARLEERTNFILQQLNGMQKPEEKPKDQDPEPNPDEDFIAHHAWLARQFKAMKDADTQRTSEWQRQQEEAARATQMEQAIWDTWNQDSARYAQENPDFQNAAKWLADTRNAQLTAIGNIDQRMSSQRARDAQINAELKQIVIAAAQQNRSPAEVVYQFAQSYGYKPAEPGSKKDPAEEVKAIAERQERHMSLSNIQGGEAPKQLTAKDLASMSEAAFRKLMSNPAKAAEIDKIMGIA